MTISPSGDEATTGQQVAACRRCGQRFPDTTPSDSDSGGFCEPCLAAMWFEDRDVAVGDGPT